MAATGDGVPAGATPRCSARACPKRLSRSPSSPGRDCNCSPGWPGGGGPDTSGPGMRARRARPRCGSVPAAAGGPTMPTVESPTVESTAARPFRLGCLDARNGAVFAADDSLPVAVEIDAASGETARVFSWPLSQAHAGRPAALAILARDGSVMIASPAAGGIVEIDRGTGQARTIPLDAAAGTLIACGDTVWAVASPDWRGDQQGGRRDRRRPVIWEEPDAAEMARDQERMRHIRFHGAAAAGEETAGSALARWRAAEGDDEDLEPPTPIWRIRGGVASRIDADLEQPVLAAAGGKLAGVCRLPGDPVIKHLSPGGGSVSWRYPGSVVVIDDAGTLEVLGPVPGSGGAVCADHGSVWLLGFEPETDEDPAPEVREVRVAPGRVKQGPGGTAAPSGGRPRPGARRPGLARGRGRLSGRARRQRGRGAVPAGQRRRALAGGPGGPRPRRAGRGRRRPGLARQSGRRLARGRRAR